MRAIMREERGGISILVEVLVVLALAFTVYELWLKDRPIQPAVTQSPAKTIIDDVKEKVNDSISKQMGRVPADESTQPSVQSDK
jgi:hypothetical protein